MLPRCFGDRFFLPCRVAGVWFSRGCMLRWSREERYAKVSGHHLRACVGRVLDRVQYVALPDRLADGGRAGRGGSLRRVVTGVDVDRRRHSLQSRRRPSRSRRLLRQHWRLKARRSRQRTRQTRPMTPPPLIANPTRVPPIGGRASPAGINESGEAVGAGSESGCRGEAGWRRLRRRRSASPAAG